MTLAAALAAALLAPLSGAAAVTEAPAPAERPARPAAEAPAPASPGLDELLQEVRRLHRAEPPAATPPADLPAPEAPEAPGAVPAAAPPAAPPPAPRPAAGAGTADDGTAEAGTPAAAGAPAVMPEPAPATNAPAVMEEPAAATEVPAATEEPAAAAEAPAPVAGPARADPGAPVPAPLESPLPPSRADPENSGDAAEAMTDPRPAAPVQPVPPVQPERRVPDMMPAAPSVAAATRPGAGNMVCRDPRLRGAAIPPILHSSWPCGIALPVRINAIEDIALSSPVTLDCNTAGRLASWLTGIAEPAAEQHLGSPIAKVWIMGSYACRTRNNRPGGKVSEHGRGRAVDVGGFWLRDGRKVTLEEDWANGTEGTFLAQARRRACGLFHTVLGPGSDRFHHDHLHLDTSPRGEDPYCR